MNVKKMGQKGKDPDSLHIPVAAAGPVRPGFGGGAWVRSSTEPAADGPVDGDDGIAGLGPHPFRSSYACLCVQG